MLQPASIAPGDVLFFHGLESGPSGNKARWLHERWGADVPAFDNHAVIAARRDGTGPGRVPAEVAAGPLTTARQALARPRRVVVGSSFGGALALAMIAEGLWTGPTVLLAPAVGVLPGSDLPRGRRAVVLHGRHDDVVPCFVGHALAAAAGPDVLYWELDDDHRLSSALTRGVLDAALAWVLGDGEGG